MKTSKDRSVSPFRTGTLLLASIVVLAACGPTESQIAEIEERLAGLRAEPVLHTAPPGATEIGRFEHEPVLGWFKAGGNVSIAWASTASYQELIEWYDTQFDASYDFAVPIGVTGRAIIQDAPTPSGNSVVVTVGLTEVRISPEFSEITFDQQTHPGMRFVVAKVGEFGIP